MTMLFIMLCVGGLLLLMYADPWQTLTVTPDRRSRLRLRHSCFCFVLNRNAAATAAIVPFGTTQGMTNGLTQSQKHSGLKYSDMYMCIYNTYYILHICINLHIYIYMCLILICLLTWTACNILGPCAIDICLWGF